MAEWQPITTAPKDGSRIILAQFGMSVDTRGLDPMSDEWRARIMDDDPPRFYNLFWCVSGQWSKRFNNWNDGIEPCGLREPTHWMRIPPNPQTCPHDPCPCEDAGIFDGYSTCDFVGRSTIKSPGDAQ